MFHVKQNKYYIPEKEDLFVGYNCEICWDYTDPFWIPSNLDIIELQMYLNKEEGMSIQTKYLDREDIESLGFKLIYSPPDSTFETNRYIKGNEFEDGTIWINHSPLINHVTIISNDMGWGNMGREKSIKFKGKCPSINELRKILKLI